MDSKNIKATQTRLRELLQEMDASQKSAGNNSQGGTPGRSYAEINQELSLLMKKMLKEQFLPMGIRCGIFFGIFAIIGLIYGQAGNVLSFDVLWFGKGWVGAYVLFSLAIGLALYGLKKLYLRLTHQNQNQSQPSSPATIIPIELPRASWKTRLESGKKTPASEDHNFDPALSH